MDFLQLETQTFVNNPCIHLHSEFLRVTKSDAERIINQSPFFKAAFCLACSAASKIKVLSVVLQELKNMSSVQVTRGSFNSCFRQAERMNDSYDSLSSLFHFPLPVLVSLDLHGHKHQLSSQTRMRECFSVEYFDTSKNG